MLKVIKELTFITQKNHSANYCFKYVLTQNVDLLDFFPYFCLKMGFHRGEKDMEIISTFVQSLMIRQCVIVAAFDDFYEISAKIKDLSERKILTVYLDLYRIENFLVKIGYPEVRTGFVLKVKNEVNMLEAANELNKVNIIVSKYLKQKMEFTYEHRIKS